MTNDIEKRIKNRFQELSKGHKRIAGAILNDYDKTAYMTASSLGELAGVSESTVVRFAYELGYEGYSELQNAMRDLVRTKLTPNQRIEVTKKIIGKEDILGKVMEADIAKIRQTLELLDREAFYKSVETILEAKTVYVIGARNSEHLARLLSYNLSLIFDNVRFVQPTSRDEVFEKMFSIGNEDALVAFSFPRYSSKIVSAVKFAESKGARVISFTDSTASPLAEYSTYLLTVQSDMASFMDSLVAPLSIINAMIVEITGRREKEIRERFDTLEKIWDEYQVYTKH